MRCTCCRLVREAGTAAQRGARLPTCAVAPHQYQPPCGARSTSELDSPRPGKPQFSEPGAAQYCSNWAASPADSISAYWASGE